MTGDCQNADSLTGHLVNQFFSGVLNPVHRIVVGVAVDLYSKSKVGHSILRLTSWARQFRRKARTSSPKIGSSPHIQNRSRPSFLQLILQQLEAIRFSRRPELV